MEAVIVVDFDSGDPLNCWIRCRLRSDLEFRRGLLIFAVLCGWVLRHLWGSMLVLISETKDRTRAECVLLVSMK